MTTKIINQCIAENQNDLAIYNELLELLTPYEGKIINGITFKKFSYYNNKHLLNHIVYKEKKFYVGDYNDLFSISEFIRLNSRASSGAPERINKLQLLDTKQIDKDYKLLLKSMRQAIALHKKLYDSFNNPAIYAIMNSNIETEHLSSLIYQKSL